MSLNCHNDIIMVFAALLPVELLVTFTKNKTRLMLDNAKTCGLRRRSRGGAEGGAVKGRGQKQERTERQEGGEMKRVSI